MTDRIQPLFDFGAVPESRPAAGLRIGSLFSGIGGLDLGLERAGVGHPAWFCDVEPFALSVLACRWPGVPQLPDVREVTPTTATPIDVLCGGFPCQDISVAGKGAGLEGERSGLFFEMMRVAREFAPRFIVFENVGAIRARGLDAVLAELHGAGYDAAWSTFGADAVGAPHRRLRWWCVAWRRGDGRVPAMGSTWGPVGTQGKPPKHGVMADGRIAHGAAWARPGEAPSYPTPVASSRRCEGDVRLMRRAAEQGLPLVEAEAMVSGGLERPQGKLGAWPTPTKCGNDNRKGASPTSGDGLATAVKSWPTPTKGDGKFEAVYHGQLSRKSIGMHHAVLLWPTPIKDDGAQRATRPARLRRPEPGLHHRVVVQAAWPTPTKWEGRQAAVSPGDLRRKAPGLRADAVRADVGEAAGLDAVVQAVRDSGLTLNADWVDALMGFPVGWTADTEPQAWSGWPARPGEAQREGEPPRTVKRGTQVNRGKRISALGNAVVPQCAEVVGCKLLEIKSDD